MAKPNEMTTSPAGREAGRFREGFRSKAYQCTAGRWTFGFGSCFHYRNGFREAVKEYDTIDRAESAELFDLLWNEHEVGVGLAITADLTQPQFDTLADMCYNLGRDVLLGGWETDPATGGKRRKGTGIQRAVNSGAIERVESELMRWIYSGGRRDDGLYSRCASRVLQWNSLPFKEVCYGPGAADLLVLNPDNSIKSAVPIQIIKARARAFQSAGPIAAPAESVRVPATPPAPSNPAPVASKPDEKRDTPAAATPAPAAKQKPPVPKALKEYSAKTVDINHVPLPNVKPENGAKPFYESERFWGMFWVASGNILQQLIRRGALVGLAPSWVLLLATDAAKDPTAIAVVSTLTVAAVGALGASIVMVRAGITKKRKGDATATQTLY